MLRYYLLLTADIYTRRHVRRYICDARTTCSNVQCAKSWTAAHRPSRSQEGAWKPLTSVSLAAYSNTRAVRNYEVVLCRRAGGAGDYAHGAPDRLGQAFLMVTRPDSVLLHNTD